LARLPKDAGAAVRVLKDKEIMYLKGRFAACRLCDEDPTFPHMVEVHGFVDLKEKKWGWKSRTLSDLTKFIE
jgi:hypothetical protein